MKKIVILGGGFAGAYAAQALEKTLRKRDDVEILLYCRENYTVFQPMLPEVISGTIGLTDVVTPLRRMLRRTHVHVREIESIDVASKTVSVAAGFKPHAHVEPYDHLIIAPGTVTDFRGLPGLPEHALPFKNLADALELRSRGTVPATHRHSAATRTDGGRPDRQPRLSRRQWRHRHANGVHARGTGGAACP